MEFADFSGGAAVIEALRSGAADVGSIGEAPVPIAVDSGVTDLVTVGLQANPGTSGGYYLVAKPNSGVTTIEDLRGRRVGIPAGFGSPHDHRGAAQTARTGPASTMCSRWNSPGQRWFRPSPPVRSTRRSCWATSTTNWANRRSSATATGINTGIQTLIVRTDILDDPAKAAAIGDYVGRAVAANNWKDTHADEWINEYYVKQQGITFDQGKKLYEEDGIASYYPIDADVDRTVPDRRRRPATTPGPPRPTSTSNRTSTAATTTSSTRRTNSTASHPSRLNS